MKIGALAKATKTKVETVRNYEKFGLLCIQIGSLLRRARLKFPNQRITGLWRFTSNKKMIRRSTA